jgi:hypothetical protein
MVVVSMVYLAPPVFKNRETILLILKTFSDIITIISLSCF